MAEHVSADYDRDCRRLGLRCVDCLPRIAWCDLCVERHVIPSAAPGDSLDDHEERYFPSHYEPGVFPSAETAEGSSDV